MSLVRSQEVERSNGKCSEIRRIKGCDVSNVSGTVPVMHMESYFPANYGKIYNGYSLCNCSIIKMVGRVYFNVTSLKSWEVGALSRKKPTCLHASMWTNWSSCQSLDAHAAQPTLEDKRKPKGHTETHLTHP